MSRKPSRHSIDPEIAMWQAKAMYAFMHELYEYYSDNNHSTSQENIKIEIEQGIVSSVSGRIICAPIIWALATEIALKAWQGHENDGRCDHCHNLFYLFNSLASGTQKQIEQRFKKLRGTSNNTSVHDILYTRRNLFVNWRYAHEDEGLEYGVGDLKLALTSIIDVYHDAKTAEIV